MIQSVEKHYLNIIKYVTDLIVTRDCVTYVIVTSNQYLFVSLLYPCKLSALSLIRYKTGVVDTCQFQRRIDRRIVAISRVIEAEIEILL